MTLADEENRLLEDILPQLQDEGYQVFLHPNRNLLPAFMGSYMPDAIAIGASKNLAIEIVSSNSASRRKVEEINERFKKEDKWELRIYYSRPLNVEEKLKTVPLSYIESTLRKVEEFAENDEIQAAILLAWAAFEAIGRAISPNDFTRPQSPARLVEVLATKGYLTPNEADTFRSFIDSRNRLIHGDLTVMLSSHRIKRFAVILRTLQKQLTSQ